MGILRRRRHTSPISVEAADNQPNSPDDGDTAASALASETSPAAPPRSGLARLLRRRSRTSHPQEAAPPHPTMDEIHPKSLSPLARMSRALRNLREGIALRRRRRICTLSIENGVIRAVVFDGDEIVGWAIADPEEGDPFESDLTAQPVEADMMLL